MHTYTSPMVVAVADIEESILKVSILGLALSEIAINVDKVIAGLMDTTMAVRALALKMDSQYSLFQLLWTG